MQDLSRRCRPVALGMFVIALAAAPVGAEVDLSVDARTLSDLLATMVPSDLPLAMVGDRTVMLELDDLRVTGFEPAAAGGRGLVRTSLRVRIPQLGFEVSVRPGLSLHLTERDGRSVCSLSFDEVKIPLPVAGEINIAPLLPRIPVPADTTNLVRSQRGLFAVRTRLVAAQMGTTSLRLRFDLEVTPAEAPEP